MCPVIHGPNIGLRYRHRTRLGCWRTGHGDHRPTLRARAFYLENWFLITGYNVSRHYFACFWGLKANESAKYLVPITTVLRRRLLQYFIGDYSSTWPRLLQYLVQITAVLGPSTGTKYWRTDFEGEPYSCCLEF